MRKHLVCFLVILSVVLSGFQIVLAQDQDVNRINSLLQKETWKLTYHDTGKRWRKLEFYSFQNAFMVNVVYEKVVNYFTYERETSMLYQVYSTNTIRFICPDLLAPFPKNFKAKIVKLSEKVLMLKVGRGLDVFLREDVKPEIAPASLRKCWYGSKDEIEYKLCFHSSRVKSFARRKNSSSFVRGGDFPFEFFDLGTPSLIKADFGKDGIDYLLFYPKEMKMVEEEGGITFTPSLK